MVDALVFIITCVCVYTRKNVMGHHKARVMTLLVHINDGIAGTHIRGQRLWPGGGGKLFGARHFLFLPSLPRNIARLVLHRVLSYYCVTHSPVRFADGLGEPAVFFSFHIPRMTHPVSFYGRRLINASLNFAVAATFLFFFPTSSNIFNTRFRNSITELFTYECL